MPVKLTMSPMVRARRAAQSVNHGEDILHFLEQNRGPLVRAASTGIPPVSVVSKGLKAKFPTEMKTAPVRQFVGIVVKALLASEGFEVAQTGVRLPRDTVFSTGSVYRRASEDTDPAKSAVRDAFARQVSGLNVSEKRILLDVLRTAMGEA